MVEVLRAQERGGLLIAEQQLSMSNDRHCPPGRGSDMRNDTMSFTRWTACAALVATLAASPANAQNEETK